MRAYLLLNQTWRINKDEKSKDENNAWFFYFLFASIKNNTWKHRIPRRCGDVAAPTVKVAFILIFPLFIFSSVFMTEKSFHTCYVTLRKVLFSLAGWVLSDWYRVCCCFGFWLNWTVVSSRLSFLRFITDFTLHIRLMANSNQSESPNAQWRNSFTLALLLWERYCSVKLVGPQWLLRSFLL